VQTLTASLQFFSNAYGRLDVAKYLNKEGEMKKVGVMAVLMFAVGLTSCSRPKLENSRHVVLPSSKLIGCRSSGCSQVWFDDAADSHAIYPQNISIDIDDKGVLGLVARYDKTTVLDDIRASIENRYGKWAFPKDHTGPARVWRVEPERVAIQLAEDDDGTKEVIYLSARAWLPGRGKATP